MNLSRALILLLLVMFVSVSASAQRYRQRLPAPRDPQFYQPRNQLEYFDGRIETLLVRGRLERRLKQRRASADTLREALRLFERIGALMWAEQARRDDRVAGAGDLDREAEVVGRRRPDVPLVAVPVARCDDRVAGAEVDAQVRVGARVLVHAPAAERRD